MTGVGPASILIAEDYPDFRQRLLALLEPLALTCTAVSNGRQAIELLANAAHAVDLLVTDMDMPVNNGWEVIDAARTHRGSDLPVIMQTGEAKYTYVRRRAEGLGIILIDKADVNQLLVPAVTDLLGIVSGGANP
ncbi:MAG: response regulator [Dehalococcoidia bacterium]